MVFSKIKERLIKQDIDLENLFSSSNFEALKEKSANSLKKFFQSVDNNTKNEIHLWIKSVREIRADQDASDETKEEKLRNIKTSETILKFLKSLIEALAEQVPVQNKSVLKAGIAGVGIAASILSFEVSGIALLVLSKALPKFVLSKHFEDFASFVEKELPVQE